MTESHDATGGRRLALHEYPLREEPYAEDLGRRAREYSLELYVLGANYMDARDKLVAALEQSGPGNLVHPYLGTHRVAVREYRLRETTREGGIATFSVTFVEAGTAAEPGAAADTAGGVLGAVNSALDAIEADFAGVFDVIESAGHVAEEAVTAVEETMDRVTRLVGSVTGPIAAVIRSPANMAAEITGAVGKLRALIRQPADALKLYESLFDAGSGLPAVPLVTPDRKQQARNQEAIQRIVRRAAVIETARAAATTHFPSADGTTARRQFPTSDTSLATRDAIVDAIDAQLEEAGIVDGRPVSDDAYQAMSDLKAASIRDLTVRAAALPRTARYTLCCSTPALVVAYRVHGDALRDAEIVSRNRVRHPGFVPGGVALEVLSDA